jgi:hypothetical protein
MRDQGGVLMFQVSRSLYRRIAPLVVGYGPHDIDQRRLRVLDACERTMCRLETEPDFAHPARFLFEEIRACLPITEQGAARKLIDFHIEVARDLLQQMPRERRRCQAFTRKGTPCDRDPVNDEDFCPSHRHLVHMAEREFA